MHPYPWVLLGAYVFLFLLLCVAAGFFVYAGIRRQSVGALFPAALFGAPALLLADRTVRHWTLWRRTREVGLGTDEAAGED